MATTLTLNPPNPNPSPFTWASVAAGAPANNGTVTASGQSSSGPFPANPELKMNCTICGQCKKFATVGQQNEKGNAGRNYAVCPNDACKNQFQWTDVRPGDTKPKYSANGNSSGNNGYGARTSDTGRIQQLETTVGTLVTKLDAVNNQLFILSQQVAALQAHTNTPMQQ